MKIQEKYQGAEESTGAQHLYTERVKLYHILIKVVLYFQGLRNFFLHYKELGSGLKVLDAGCGAGTATFALTEAMEKRNLKLGPFHAFDYTPAMLNLFRERIKERNRAHIVLHQADVLRLDHDLPASWKNYDLVISTSMLEYLPVEKVAQSLSSLKQRLAPGGKCLIYISCSNWLTSLVIERWWKARTYSSESVSEFAIKAAFSKVKFHRFKGVYSFLNYWGVIAELSD